MPILMSLTQTLNLVGKLDDSMAPDCPREQFRRFLTDNVKDIGQLRDYVEECLRQTGDQYARALQDLVNHLGVLLGYEVDFGRYQGASGAVGFDGHWISRASGFHIVVEVKTTEAYAIKTSVLVGYIDRLISDKQIPSWDRALGLYVVGRPDPQVKQLENAIVAEKRTDQLRVISVESLLLLGEMMARYGVGHDDVLAVLQPSGPNIDTIVDLMQRLVGSSDAIPDQEPPALQTPAEPPAYRIEEKASVTATYWLTPVKSTEEETADECIQSLIGQHHIYAFGDRTPGRGRIKIGDWICFYSNGKGVVAHARVASMPQKQPNKAVKSSEQYPWVFSVDAVRLYLEKPVTIDGAKRAELEAFKDRDLAKSWAWFVQSTKEISKHDFDCLTRR